MGRLLRSPIVWFGLAISAGGLFLAFRGLHWQEVGEALADANYGLLVLAVLLVVVTIVTRAVRWGILFHPRRDLGFNNLLGALNIGYAINNMVPARLGEVVRAYAIRETERVSVAHAISTILVERTLDTIVVIAMLMLTLPFIDAPAWARWPAFFLGLGFLGFAALLAALSAAREGAMRFVSWAVRFLPERFRAPALQAADAAIEGFGTLRNPWVLTQALAWSIISWVASALFMYVTLRAFGLDVSFTAGVFLTSATSLGMIVPASPGYIGVFHAIAIESLTNVFDANRNDAASFALVTHAMMYLVPMVMAAIFLWRERKTWRRVRLWVLQGGDASTEQGASALEAETADR
jgi:uncharacterized protein (TIRG00374 family)